MMRTFDYILIICAGLVLSQAGMVITLNTKRDHWEATNKSHVLSTVLYLTYLIVGVCSTYWCSRSEWHCDILWKVCSTLYVGVNVSVYSFYYVKSRVVNNVLWRGRNRYRGLVIVSIVIMGIAGISIIWVPIKHVQYTAKLIDGECYSGNRRYVVIAWVVADSLFSVLLLQLFIRPITVIKKTLGDSPRSVATLRSMKRLTEKNRNLLLCSILVSTGIFTPIAILRELQMTTVIYLCTIDRLVTLQCITMTFTYDGREYYYCRACFKNRDREIEEKEESFHMTRHNSGSTSQIVISSGTGYESSDK